MRPIPTCSGCISKNIAAILLLMFALAFAATAKAEDATLEVISLQHRTAAEMLPLIQTFVAKDGMIKADGSKLIMRTTPANLAELRKLIAELDKPVRRLLITVKLLSGETARDSGSTMTSQVSDDGETSHISTHVWRTEKRDNTDRVQQVQVNEGGQAFIDVGQQIPITDFGVALTQSGVFMNQDTRYATATTGFYAHPQISGDNVTVDISPYQTTTADSASPPTFNTQSLHTTVTGKLGEWIAIGGSTPTTDQDNKAVIEHSTSQRGEQDKKILLRVTVIP